MEKYLTTKNFIGLVIAMMIVTVLASKAHAEDMGRNVLVTFEDKVVINKRGQEEIKSRLLKKEPKSSEDRCELARERMQSVYEHTGENKKVVCEFPEA